MPIREYDKYFGGEKGSAQKAKDAMARTYKGKKAEEVFFATKNKKKSQMGGKSGKD